MLQKLNQQLKAYNKPALLIAWLFWAKLPHACTYLLSLASLPNKNQQYCTD